MDPIPHYVALYGGKSVPVRSRAGTEGVVHLRLIALSECGCFLDIHRQDGERAAALFVIDASKSTLPAEATTEGQLDFDQLADESYTAVLEENLALNFTRALAVKRRETARAAQTGAGLRQILDEMVSILSTYAPSSPPPADSPGSKS